VAGVALPVVITVIRYAAARQVGALIYYTVTYNSDVYLDPYSTEAKVNTIRGWVTSHGILLGILAPIALWGATRPLAAASRLRDWPRAFDEHGFVATVALGALAVVAISNAALRGFIHYYVQIVPWCGLLLGVLVERAVEGRPRIGVFRPMGVRALILLPLILVTQVGSAHLFNRYAHDRRTRRAFVDLRSSDICKYIRAHSKPEESLFVWGFLPELYTTCERRPASRYVFTTFVAGYVPWFDKATLEEDDRRAVRDSRALLIADLEQSRPPVIVDAPKSMGNRSMRRYPVLARYLGMRYCPAGMQGGYAVLLRRTEAGACPAGSKR
jgi:hypothetical protein